MLRHLKLVWAAPLWAIALAGVLHGCGGGGQALAATQQDQIVAECVRLVLQTLRMHEAR